MRLFCCTHAISVPKLSLAGDFRHWQQELPAVISETEAAPDVHIPS